MTPPQTVALCRSQPFSSIRYDVTTSSSEMALVSAAVSTAGFLAPEDAAHWVEVEGDFDIGEWGPFVEALFEGLEECPDTTFVEVIDRDNVVRVAKARGKIRVEVRDPDLSLRVAVPIRPIRRTVTSIIR